MKLSGGVSVARRDQLYFCVSLLGIMIHLRSSLPSFGIRAMDTRLSTDLKKILETMEADKRKMAQKMQEQIHELVISQSRGEESPSSASVNKGGMGGWHPNDIRVGIPEYDGKLDPNEFVEWLRTVERVFDYKQTTEDNKVKIVALKLRKYASTWCSNTCLKCERSGKEQIQTWPKMKTKMKQKFLPTYYVQNSFSQLHSLKQGTGTTEEYSRPFEYLLMKCDVPEDDPQKLVRYLGGLEPRVANVFELHSYQTLTELTEYWCTNNLLSKIASTELAITFDENNI